MTDSEKELVNKLRVGPVGRLTCDDAAAAIERLARERDDAEQDRARELELAGKNILALMKQVETITRERDEARAERDDAEGIWPEWAQQILERLKEHGYQYDAEEEIQLPDDFIAHVEGWLQATEDRYKARAEAAEAEAARLREALKIWQDAYATGRNESLAIAANVTRNELEAKHD